LFPEKFIPKHHFLLHLPRQCQIFGPLKNQFCLAFEAKHNVTKSVRWYNFKNLPFSVAKYLRINTITNFLTDDGRIVDYPFQALPILSKKSLKYGSIEYQVGDILNQFDDQNHDYRFFKILELFSDGTVKVQSVDVVEYNANMLAFIVQDNEVTTFLSLQKLLMPWPLTKIRVNDKFFVIQRCRHNDL